MTCLGIHTPPAQNECHFSDNKKEAPKFYTIRFRGSHHVERPTGPPRGAPGTPEGAAGVWGSFATSVVPVRRRFNPANVRRGNRVDTLSM